MTKIEIYDILQKAQSHISQADKCRDDTRHILNSITVLLQFESVDQLRENPKTFNSVDGKLGDLIRALFCEEEEARQAKEIYQGFRNNMNGVKEKEGKNDI